jgi:hypothetical protein
VASDRLPPEAILTWDSVRRLETHTDIGPGNVGPLLIEVNFRQHERTLALLREAGYWIAPPPSEWVACHGTQADHDYRCKR